MAEKVYAEAGKCPYCNSTNVEYEYGTPEDGDYNYYCHCMDCKKQFIEGYVLEFVGMFDPETGERLWQSE